MDGDAALVTAVDEVKRTLLGEVRVGDDHLVRRAPLAEDVGQRWSQLRPRERRPFWGRGVSEM